MKLIEDSNDCHHHHCGLLPDPVHLPLHEDYVVLSHDYYKKVIGSCQEVSVSVTSYLIVPIQYNINVEHHGGPQWPSSILTPT